RWGTGRRSPLLPPRTMTASTGGVDEAGDVTQKSNKLAVNHETNKPKRVPVKIFAAMVPF
ncbi:MAG: hypothetical protein M3536_11150, partial [Actinomycetota bacterium]|nr:hypothetical protein [Actinomycetota bacterium]